MTSLEFVQSLLPALVEHPTETNVEKTVDELGVLLTITVAPTDVGMVIGRGGEVVRAIRLLAKVIGHKQAQRVSVRITNNQAHTLLAEQASAYP